MTILLHHRPDVIKSNKHSFCINHKFRSRSFSMYMYTVGMKEQTFRDIKILDNLNHCLIFQSNYNLLLDLSGTLVFVLQFVVTI